MDDSTFRKTFIGGAVSLYLGLFGYAVLGYGPNSLTEAGETTIRINPVEVKIDEEESNARDEHGSDAAVDKRAARRQGPEENSSVRSIDRRGGSFQVGK